jgi:hypothetical protein
MIADSFDSRTLANMEVVLERHVKSSRRGPRNMNFVGIAPAKSSNAQRVATKHLEALRKLDVPRPPNSVR